MDPAPLLEALEGGVEGAVVHQEGVPRARLDGEHDSVPMMGLEGEDPEDEKVEGSLEEGISRRYFRSS